MTEPSDVGFYRPWPLFGKKFSNQLPESRYNSEVLAALVQAAGLDLDTPLGNSDLMSWELGQHNFHNRFRFIYDDMGTALKIQKNDGTEGTPVWVDALTIDYETLATTVTGTFSSSFYLGLNRVALHGLNQIQPTQFYNVTDLYFSADDGFYFTTGPGGDPVVRLSDRVTGGGGGGGLSSINVRSTVSSPTYATDTIIFDKDDFYLSPSSAGKPIVSLNAEAIAALSSITVDTTVPLPTFSTSTIRFDRSDFYLSPDSTGIPIVSLAAEDVNTTSVLVKTTDSDGFFIPPEFNTDKITFNRGDFYITPDSEGKPIINLSQDSSGSGAGDTTVVSGVQSQYFLSGTEWIFPHNLNSRPLLWDIYDDNFEAVIPDKLDISDNNTAYFYFSEAVSGTAIVSSGRTSVDLTGGFYGMSIRNNPPTESFKNIGLISFDSAAFYLTQNAPNTDEVLVSMKQNPISQNTADARYLKLSADNDPLTGTLDTQGILPTIDDTWDLGSTNKRWSDVHIAGNGGVNWSTTNYIKTNTFFASPFDIFYFSLGSQSFKVGNALFNLNSFKFQVEPNATAGFRIFTSARTIFTISGTGDGAFSTAPGGAIDWSFDDYIAFRLVNTSASSTANTQEIQFEMRNSATTLVDASVIRSSLSTTTGGGTGTLLFQNLIGGAATTWMTATGKTVDISGTLAVDAGTSTSNAAVGGILSKNVTAVGNVGVGEDDLMTYTLPALVMSPTNSSIKFRASGTIANNANAKRIRVKFGATTIFDTGAAGIPVSEAISWVMTGEVIHGVGASQKCNVMFNTSSATYPAFASYATAAEVITLAIVLKLTGEATTDNDISQETMTVEWESV